MSLDVDGFTNDIEGGEVIIKISSDHRLLKLVRNLPWDEMLEAILPDLKRTEKKCWWMGRPIRVRIHLGIYILQQMLDLTDRVAEQQVRDNAAFRLFCGYGLLKKWHAPDHTKIETFRSRLTAETQRKLANMMSQQAVKLGYANPANYDVDSTVQESNTSYPALVNLLLKVAILTKTAAKALNQYCHSGHQIYHVNISRLKQIALYYFRLKRDKSPAELLKSVQKRLWSETYEEVLPVLNNMHQLTNKVAAGKHWPIRRAMDILSWRGCQLLQQIHGYLFEGIINTSISSLHAYDVGCFNKGKLSKGLQFGRAYQLGRVDGNFLVVGECTSVYMPDAASLPAMIALHQNLFGQRVLQSIATDKGYYSFDNERRLEAAGVKDIYLPRPNRTLNAPLEKTPGPIRQLLHDRRAGIEPLIGHTKQGGQMGRSRMKSDETTKSAGYASVFGFNARQLTRYLAGEVRSKTDKVASVAANDCQIVEEVAIKQG